MKLAWLAGTLTVALAPALALASPRESPLPPVRPAAPAVPTIRPPPPGDGLAGGGFFIQADRLIQNEADHTVTAQGHVEARYRGRVLRADQVTYDSATGIVAAKGHVAIVNPDGTAEFASSAVLNGTFSQGVAFAFSTRLKQHVTIAAASAVRRSASFQQLNEVIFTPCPVCAREPTPTWSIRARTAVEDKKKQIVYFRDAVIEIHDLPVFYLPVFWEADPSVARKSGLLTPEVSNSGLRGFSWEQPYLQVISPSEDLVISPQLNTKVNPFLNLDWRKRFWSGAIEARAGYTYERDFTSSGHRFGPLTSRSYILAKGLFAGPDDWQWGFTAERTSDPLIFQKYGISDVFIDRGLYAAEDQRLISQLYAVRQKQNSYISVAAIDIQGLRPTDVNGAFPLIAPLIEARYEPDQPILGGRLRIDASGVVLTRDESPIDPTELGVDSRRATLQGDWRRSIILADGIRIDPFVEGRVDIYNLANLPAPFARNATIARGFGAAGFTASWPFYKTAGPVTYIVQPIAQLSIAPLVKQDPRIPNEDSADFVFDTTNLFQVNKSPGFDLIDSGQILDLGGEASAEFGDGRNASVIFGRSLRAEPDPSLPARTGLEGLASDWVVGVEGSPIKGFDFFSRWRLDSRSLSINRMETGVDLVSRRVSGSIRYLEEAQDPSGAPVKYLDFRGEVYLLKHWGVTAYGDRDFLSGEWRRRGFGVVYRDDCIRVEVVYRQDEIFNRTLGPTSGVFLRLSLATLGNSGYSPTSSVPGP
ncbi:MAG TPA: LPS assembly protein LptD [Caulobacteraceae bacterium]|nr:LPS assembly protein LptD [Caulobacteraceae bacterium]